MTRRLHIFTFVALLTACGPELANKRGTSSLTSSSGSSSVAPTVDGELTQLPEPKYRDFDLCKAMLAAQLISADNQAAVSDLCGEEDLLSDLRKAPDLYDGSGEANVRQKLEEADDDVIELAWYESLRINATAKQALDLYRLRTSAPTTFRKFYEESPDLSFTPEEISADKARVIWENGRMSSLPQAFTAEITYGEIEPEQTYIAQWSLVAEQAATKSYTQLVIFNQAGLNVTEMISYIHLTSEHGDQATGFKSQTYDSRRELLRITRDNAVGAYLAADRQP